jgi:hypothetical protein
MWGAHAARTRGGVACDQGCVWSLCDTVTVMMIGGGGEVVEGWMEQLAQAVQRGGWGGFPFFLMQTFSFLWLSRIRRPSTNVTPVVDGGLGWSGQGLR